MRTKFRSKTITERTTHDWPRVPTHPGEMLWEEFLKPLGISQVSFAKRLGVSLQRVNGIIRGKRSVTADTAVLLGEAFSMSPQFWINLQAGFDLATARIARIKSGKKLLPIPKAAHTASPR